MTRDARIAADAGTLEALLRGELAESDARVQELFARRPEWRELAEQARTDPSAGAQDWSASADPGDARLVAECLASARQPAAESRRTAARPRRLRLWLALAATVALALAAGLWWSRDRGPARPADLVLGYDLRQGDFHDPEVAADFSAFAWKFRPLESGSESFVLSIWEDAAGKPGRLLYRSLPTRSTRVTIEKDRSSWPPAVIWQVDVGLKDQVPSASARWRAPVDPH